jgi:hypothetical protein
MIRELNMMMSVVLVGTSNIMKGLTRMRRPPKDDFAIIYSYVLADCENSLG